MFKSSRPDFLAAPGGKKIEQESVEMREQSKQDEEPMAKRPLQISDLAIIRQRDSTEDYIVESLIIDGPEAGIHVKYVVDPNIKQHLIYTGDQINPWKVKGIEEVIL